MARFSRNVSSGGRSHTSCCRLPSTSAMRRLNGGPPVQGTNPAASTRPLVGYKSPASILSVVVLPAPFGPRNATISPGSIPNVTSRTACTSRYRGRRSARRAPRSPGSRTFTWNVLLNRSASTIDGMGVREIYPGTPGVWPQQPLRSEEHTSELQSRLHLVCRLLLEKKKKYRQCIMTEIPEHRKL